MFNVLRIYKRTRTRPADTLYSFTKSVQAYGFLRVESVERRQRYLPTCNLTAVISLLVPLFTYLTI
jgi:hypothetical protein